MTGTGNAGISMRLLINFKSTYLHIFLNWNERLTDICHSQKEANTIRLKEKKVHSNKKRDRKGGGGDY